MYRQTVPGERPGCKSPDVCGVGEVRMRQGQAKQDHDDLGDSRAGSRSPGRNACSPSAPTRRGTSTGIAAQCVDARLTCTGQGDAQPVALENELRALAVRLGVPFADVVDAAVECAANLPGAADSPCLRRGESSSAGDSTRHDDGPGVLPLVVDA